MTERLSPDDITLDLVMPRMDGLEFLRRQMAKRPVPVVVCSISHESGAAAIEALELGAVDFIQKPTALATDRVYEIAAELVPNYLPAVPTDWYSKTREPMRYKKVDPKADPLGRGFLVYSVGLDNTDDAGTIDPKRLNRAINSGEEMGKGYDFVINWTDQLPDRK